MLNENESASYPAVAGMKRKKKLVKAPVVQTKGDQLKEVNFFSPEFNKEIKGRRKK